MGEDRVTERQTQGSGPGRGMKDAALLLAPDTGLSGGMPGQAAVIGALCPNVSFKYLIVSHQKNSKDQSGSFLLNVCKACYWYKHACCDVFCTFQHISALVQQANQIIKHG